MNFIKKKNKIEFNFRTITKEEIESNRIKSYNYLV